MERAGSRNCVIELQRIVRSVDANGIRSESWYTYATLWAQLISRSESETERVGTTGSVGRVDFKTSFYPGVSRLDRVNYNHTIYNIQSVDDVGELHRDLTITAQVQSP